MRKHEIKPLSEEEVQISRKEHGSNMLTPPEETSFWAELWGNFRGDALIRILTVALVLTLVFALLGWGDWLEAIGIGIAVVLATTVSTYSEYSNNKLFQKLQEEYSKFICKVYRRAEGKDKICDIKIDEIVVGDYVLLQSGDKISADGVVVDGDIKVNQASLNGESEEAKKTAAGADYTYDAEKVDFLDVHKLYRGAVVTDGEAIMQVKCVGDKSQFGKLAQELNEEDDRESPLKVKLGALADGISKFGYIGGILIAIAFMINCMFTNPVLVEGATTYLSMANWHQIVIDVVNSITLAIVIIVVAVPEGLPMMIALVSGLNMKKLLKDNILIRKIDGAETAGSLNILFSDKTGTITKGALQVVNFYTAKDTEYTSYSTLSPKIKEMLIVSIKGNTGCICMDNGDGLQITGGNVTDRALHEFLGVEGEREYNQHVVTIQEELMFNSKNKYSAAQVAGEYQLTLVKGAPEKVIEKCAYYYDENLERKPFDAAQKKKVDDRMLSLANKAMRVLAFATTQEEISESLSDGMTFLGIVGIRDELRPEAVTAIHTAQEAGIQVVMVTGDKKETAFAIAKDARLVQSDSEAVLTSEELNALTDEELKGILPRLRVVARALPTDKSRLVRVSQESGLVVGMTGDGVNDAPALKKADVGFAMGSGTEVSKEAADITILDDNFNSVVKTVLYGRTIYNNIRKFIVFQLTINVSAVCIAFLGPFIGIGKPLTVTQMLWVNIVMDTLAALALGGEPPLQRYMQEKPKRRDEFIISKDMWSSFLTMGFYLTVTSFIFLLVPFFKQLFRIGPSHNESIFFMTGFFAFYVLSAMFNGFNARTEKLNIFDNITQNKGFLTVMLLIVVVQFVMTYLGGAVLRTAGLNFNEWIVVFVCALAIVPIGILRKLIFGAHKRV